MRHWHWQQQEPRDKRGWLGVAQDGAWGAGPQRRRRKGRAGPARRGAAQRSSGALSWLSAAARRALPPSTTAARRRSLGPGARGIPWGLTPRPQTRSGRQNWARRAARDQGAMGSCPGPCRLPGPAWGPLLPGLTAVSAGAEPPRNPAGLDAADPAHCGAGSPDLQMSARGSGCKRSKNRKRVPISRSELPRPKSL